MLQVTCKQCMAAAYVTDGQDVHEALECPCCPGEHHHGQAAGECPAEHDGACWQGPQSGPKPDGCGVCRPVHIRANVTMTLGG